MRECADQAVIVNRNAPNISLCGYVRIGWIGRRNVVKRVVVDDNIARRCAGPSAPNRYPIRPCGWIAVDDVEDLIMINLNTLGAADVNTHISERDGCTW